MGLHMDRAVRARRPGRGLAARLDRAPHGPMAAHQLAFGLVAALGIALIGGTVAGLDASYRFPGPFLYGSDARSVTPELVGASEWFLAHSVPVTTSSPIATPGLSSPHSACRIPPIHLPASRTYNLYLAKPEPRSSLLICCLSCKVQLHLSGHRQAHGVRTAPGRRLFRTRRACRDRPIPHGGKPIFPEGWTEFSTIPWMVKVFQSDSYSIYRLRLPKPTGQARYQAVPPTSRGAVPQGKLVVTP